MLDKAIFWRTINFGGFIFWTVVAVLVSLGELRHPVVITAGIFLIVHVLELPVAYRLLRGRGFPPLKVFAMTMVLGFTWWVPAQRGVYKPGLNFQN